MDALHFLWHAVALPRESLMCLMAHTDMTSFSLKLPSGEQVIIAS